MHAHSRLPAAQQRPTAPRVISVTGHCSGVALESRQVNSLLKQNVTIYNLQDALLTMSKIPSKITRHTKKLTNQKMCPSSREEVSTLWPRGRPSAFSFFFFLLKMKFYWNTVMFIHLHIAYGCSQTTTTKLNRDTDATTHNPKIFINWTL